MSYSIGDLAAHVGGEVVGNSSEMVSGLGTLSGAKPGELTHLSSAHYRHYLSSTKASVVLLEEKHLAQCPTSAIVTERPYLAFARLSQLFRSVESSNCKIHPSAVIHESAELAPQVTIGANVVIEENVQIASHAIICANSTIGRDCKVGQSVCIKPNVSLYANVSIGENSIVHSGAVIGADGFGFVPDEQGEFVEIAQLGGVSIGANVSIGAATTIDRGAIENTRIGDGVKIDNQVQIGHNCIIEDHTIICGCVGVVGSTKIGKHCVLAGGVGIGGDTVIEICDGVTITARTHIMRSIDKPGVYSGGVLYSENKTWKRNAIRFGELDSLAKRIKGLEKNVAEIERNGST